MFTWFSRNNNNKNYEPDNEVDNEIQIYNDVEDKDSVEDIIQPSNIVLDIFTNSIFSKVWNNSIFVNPIFVDYYIIPIREVIPYLSTWSFNRQVNESHKDSIKNDLFNQESPHLMGSIKIARDKNRDCRVIDGQHRLIALREFIDADIDMKYNFQILFEVYSLNIADINNTSSEEFDQLEKLFGLANKSLNFETKDNPDKFCTEIVLQLSRQYDSIKNIDRVYRPCISQKYLYECLKKYLPKKYYESKVEDVVNIIKRKNNELSLMNPKNLFKNVEKSKKQYEKAKEKGFYLNLADSYFEPEKWISSL
jgi:hypothetical protein